MPTTIIVAVPGGDDARDAIALGIWLARRYDAPLALASVVVSHAGPAARVYERDTIDAARRRLEDLADAIPADVRAGVVVTVAQTVARGLDELAEAQEDALLVLGPSHLGRVARAVRGDVALEALHGAACAVVTAPRGFAERSPSCATIGVAWAPGPEAAEALVAGRALAVRCRATLRLLHVIEASAPLAPTYLDPSGASGYIKARRQDARAELGRVAAAINDVPVQIEVLEGPIGPELARASARVDVLVTGSRAYGPVRRALIGSATAALLDRAASPVMVLPRGVEVAVLS